MLRHTYMLGLFTGEKLTTQMLNITKVYLSYVLLYSLLLSQYILMSRFFLVNCLSFPHLKFQMGF